MYSARNSAIFRFALMVAAMACAASALAVVRTNTLENGASNWNDANSYTDKTFVPGAGDVVIIPSPATVYLSSEDTASFNIMSNLSYLVFTHTNSVLEITVPEGGDALFECQFKGLWEPTGNGQYYSGLIIKKGKGRITAGDGSKYEPDKEGGGPRVMPIRIEQGTWRCPQNIPGTKNAWEWTNSRVHIEEGAFFCLSSGNPNFYNQISCLTGKGTVTTSDSVKRQFRIMDQQYGGTSHFEGVLDEYVYYFAGARVFLEGTNSVMKYNPVAFSAYDSYATNKGYTAVMKFGMAGEPSSIGTSAGVDINSRGGGWGYLGPGETTDKIFGYYPQQVDGVSYVSLLLDAGANGGLVFTGQWKPLTKGVGSIVLTGSNTVSACVVDCPIQYDPLKTTQAYTNPVSVVKTGTGKWRFKHNQFRELLGVFDIQQGTIQADSFEEAGVYSALGLANNMYVEGFTCSTDQIPPANKRVADYAIVMGAEAADSIAGVATEGTLEYTGTNSSYCITRPFVLDGDARLKNSTTHRFWTGKVRSRSAGAKTLTLDGDGANTNLVADITDAGAGAISLAKEGAGTWIVSGTNDIRGDIAVKAGTLVLQNINGQKHTWHKWVIRSNWSNILDPGPTFANNRRYTIFVQEFGLFDANGDRVNLNLGYCADYTDLEPGQAAFSTPQHARYGTIYQNEALEGWFKGTEGSSNIQYFYLKPGYQGAQGILPDDPFTWRSVTMRLADDAADAVSWDFANRYKSTDSDENPGAGIRSSTLYGSANGVDWEVLDSADEVPLRTSANQWAFDGRGVTGSHTNCNTIAAHVQNAYPFLGNMAGALSVASGATLVCEGAATTFSRLKLDASGAGTIRGATFAENGELSVENVQPDDSLVFAGLFDGCSAEANIAGWTIRENGAVTSRRTASVRGGTLRILRKGLLISIK